MVRVVVPMRKSVKDGSPPISPAFHRFVLVRCMSTADGKVTLKTDDQIRDVQPEFLSDAPAGLVVGLSVELSAFPLRWCNSDSMYTLPR